MFVQKLNKENQNLIDFAHKMHQEGKFLPDTYVLDVDQIIENGKKIVKSCGNDITPLFMLKQIGRNPYIGKKLLEIGFSGAVAVDFKDCLTLMQNNIPIIHAGHLVQIPSKLIKKLLEYGVKYITVYSYEKAVEINKIATELGIVQEVFVKIYADKESLYNGQHSGVLPEETLNFVRKIDKLNHLKVNGLTTFPAFIYDCNLNDIVKTKNMDALTKANEVLKAHNIFVKELNLPSSNCVYNTELVKSLGGTMIEPGHSLTGSTMMHEKNELEEKISYLYLSEVSHTFNDYTSVYGGGFYSRGKLSNALVGLDKTLTDVLPLTPESIDYYLQLKGTYSVGTPVVMCFRTQMFFTRSCVALVEGLNVNNPQIIGLYDSQGNAKTL